MIRFLFFHTCMKKKNVYLYFLDKIHFINLNHEVHWSFDHTTKWPKGMFRPKLTCAG